MQFSNQILYYLLAPDQIVDRRRLLLSGKEGEFQLGNVNISFMLDYVRKASEDEKMEVVLVTDIDANFYTYRPKINQLTKLNYHQVLGDYGRHHPKNMKTKLEQK